MHVEITLKLNQNEMLKTQDNVSEEIMLLVHKQSSYNLFKFANERTCFAIIVLHNHAIERDYWIQFKF